MDGCSVAELPAEGHKEGDAVDKENVNGQEDISVQVQELPWDLDQVAHHRHRLSPGGLAFECIDALAPDGMGDVNVFGCDGAVRLSCIFRPEFRGIPRRPESCGSGGAFRRFAGKVPEYVRWY